MNYTITDPKECQTIIAALIIYAAKYSKPDDKTRVINILNLLQIELEAHNFATQLSNSVPPTTD